MKPFFQSEDLEVLLQRLRQPLASGADASMARSKRRDRGVYFTPAPLVEFVVEHILDSLEPIHWRADGLSPLRALDPAAGDGRFIDAFAAALARRSEGRLSHQAALAGCVALERDPALAATLVERLPGADVRCCESLLGAGDIGEFDVVIGNPPYVRSIRLGQADGALREQLRGHYRATSHGEWDLYTAFIEQSHAWLRAGGLAGLVVPSRWLTAQSARELRRLLAEKAAVRAVLDFGSEQLFEQATTYVSVVVLSAAPSPHMTVARLRDASFDVGEVVASTLDSKPWNVSVGRGRELVESMRAAGPPLGELARIAKGTGTNADRVFVLEDDVHLEEAIVRRCVRGRDVQPSGRQPAVVRCLVPYRDDGRLIEPDELRRDFPLAFAYLEARREVLEAREGGRFCGDRFYQYGRPQNLRLLLAKRAKIIVPDVTREGRAILEEDGALVLDSAYAVIPTRAEHTARILEVLNSPAVAHWLRETGVPLRGGYVRMKTAYLNSLPIALGRGPLPAAYGIDSSAW